MAEMNWGAVIVQTRKLKRKLNGNVMYVLNVIILGRDVVYVVGL